MVTKSDNTLLKQVENFFAAGIALRDETCYRECPDHGRFLVKYPWESCNCTSVAMARFMHVGRYGRYV